MGIAERSSQELSNPRGTKSVIFVLYSLANVRPQVGCGTGPRVGGSQTREDRIGDQVTSCVA